MRKQILSGISIGMIIIVASLGWGTQTASAFSITTYFNNNTGADGNMFDVTTFGNDVTVTSIEVNIRSDSGDGDLDIAVYTKSGTYVGSEVTPLDWTLVSTNTVTALGEGVPTFVDVTDFSLVANSVTGMYVTILDFNEGFMGYTSNVGSATFSDANIQLDLGAGKGGLFGGTAGGPRIWNGTINYDAQTVPEPTTIALLGIGLAGLAGAEVRRRRKKKAVDNS